MTDSSISLDDAILLLRMLRQRMLEAQIRSDEEFERISISRKEIQTRKGNKTLHIPLGTDDPQKAADLFERMLKSGG